MGSNKTFIHRRVLPTGATSQTVPSIPVTTIQGVDKVNQHVTLSTIALPEFLPTLHIDKNIAALVFDSSNTIYDMIIGNDIMVPLGINISCTMQTIQWQDIQIPWKPFSYFDSSVLTNVMTIESHAFFISHDDPLETYYQMAQVGKILESKYNRVNIDEAAEQQVHLNEKQRKDLATLLWQFQPLFSGKLGCYPNATVHLELKNDVKPFQTHPYPVPEQNKKVFHEELE
jgi:hypothetical protein